MSCDGWQKCLENKLMHCKEISNACIASRQGIVLARSEEFDIKEKELKELIMGFANRSMLTTKGVFVAGQKYIYLSGTDEIVRAKTSYGGVHSMLCDNCVIVAVYNKPGVSHEQVAKVVEDLGDFLNSWRI